MYSRILQYNPQQSFFLFGPRGTGKTSWVKKEFPKGIYLDLLDASLYQKLLAHPESLATMIPPEFSDWIILDEVQKIPDLLNEVHRLIESQNRRFVLTGSSARRLRQGGVNLLAGRALTYVMHPLCSQELKKDFSLERCLNFGQLPIAIQQKNPKKYLQSYVQTYLKEEVQQEGLTRNLANFARFLEAASFSQGCVLNMAEVSRDSSVERKAAENYFTILEDLLLAQRIPVFTKRAKRRMVSHPKFYFFDVGVYRTLRPHGPLDAPEEIEGIALESLIYQELRALNDYFEWEYELFYWRTSQGREVDFVLYGPKGLVAIEVKRNTRIRSQDLLGLRSFQKDYAQTKGYLLYGGDRRLYEDKIEIWPVNEFIKALPEILS